MVALRGELDQGPLAEVSDLDAVSNIAALLEEAGDASAGRAQPLAERAMSDLEAPHGRAALLGVVRGGGAVFVYAGAYAFGRTMSKVSVEEGRKRVGRGVRRPLCAAQGPAR